MKDFVSIRNVSQIFGPNLTTGDKIASMLGSKIETRSIKAVSEVSLNVAKGETLGLVGESGCGKSTLGRIIAGILQPTLGTISIDGSPIVKNGRKITTRVQTVFQDPFASLDPRMKVGGTISEGPIAHGLTSKEKSDDYVSNWFEKVGLDPVWLDRYPHQFSGGQRQRVAIARALAMQPDVLICDEPVASLDVSIQADILNLLKQLQNELNLTYLFISHDLSVVAHVCDIVAVMYLGHIVEMAPSRKLFKNPKHSYTKALLSSIPSIDPENKSRAIELEGEIPSALNPPSGCVFRTRCPNPCDNCRNGNTEMGLIEVEPGHWVDQCCVNCN